jgi:transposase
MNLFQIGLMFSLLVHTYLLTCETGYWSIFIYVYIWYLFGMVRQKLTIPERWQAVGMHNGGLSHRRVADHFRVNHSIIVWLIQCFRQTGNVTDRPRAGRPRKTTPREDRPISRRARQRPFSTAGALRDNLAFGGHISIRTVIRRLHHQGMRARRAIKRPQLILRHRHARLDRSHDHLGWTIRTWRRIHWSDENPKNYIFLLKSELSKMLTLSGSISHLVQFRSKKRL